MNLLKSFLTCFFLIIALSFHTRAQDIAEPYTARAYWLELKNTTYQDILIKKEHGDSLSGAQNDWLTEYTRYLENYFAKLPDSEKTKYQQFKIQWDEEFTSKKEAAESDILEEKSKGVRPGRKYSLYNGFYGFAYGSAALSIFEINLGESPGAIAIPFLTAGASLLWPLANKARYLDLPYSSVMLARHGKFVGALHGAALGFAIFGDDPTHASQILLPAVIGSIGLGELGFQFGKHKNWSEGRIATYQYYGILGPFVAFTGLIAIHAEHARPYGISVPVAGLLGYYIGDKVYKKFQFTRGDMLAISSFGLLSVGAGFGIVPVENETDMLAPLGTAIAGTIISHAMLKNKQLSVKEGWNVNYISGAGTFIGMGIALIAQAKTPQAYFLLPAAGGMVGWFAALSSQTRKPRHESSLRKERETSMSLRFMPENYLLNKRGFSPGSMMALTGLPVFQMSLSF